MNKRRRYQAKRRRSWAKAFFKIDGWMLHGPAACSSGARRKAIAYLLSHRGSTERSWS